jgi:copper(I)-binding protein
VSRSHRAVRPIGRLAVAAAIAGLACGVTACDAGNNAPTLEYHPQSTGLDTAVHGLSIIDAFVLGAPNGSLNAGQSAGLFLALSNKSSYDRLMGVSAPGVAKSVLLPAGGVSLQQYQTVYLTGPKPSIVLTGLLHPLASGSIVHVTLSFVNAGSVTLSLPVIPRTDDYATFAPAPAPSPSVSPSRRAKGSPSPSTSPTPSTSSTP